MADGPILSVDATSYGSTDDLGQVLQNTEQKRTYTFRNTGSSTLTINGTLSFSDHSVFSQGTRPSSITLGPNDTYDMVIIIDTSLGLGAHQCNIGITSDDTHSPIPYVFTIKVEIIDHSHSNAYRTSITVINPSGLTNGTVTTNKTPLNVSGDQHLINSSVIRQGSISSFDNHGRPNSNNLFSTVVTDMAIKNGKMHYSTPLEVKDKSIV